MDGEDETKEEVPVSGFSEAMAKILSHPNEPRPKKKKREVVSPKREVKLLPLDSSGVKPEGDLVLPESSTTKSQKSRKTSREKKQSDDPWHVKPDIADRERERRLTKIATRGVVQLFNAVRQQQNSIKEQLEEVGPSVRKSEKVLKSVTKDAFLDMLKDPRGSVRPGGKTEFPPSFAEQGSTEARWKVLDDQFLELNRSPNSDQESEDVSESGPERLQEVF